MYQQTQPIYDAESGIQPRPHSWEVSTLNAAPPVKKKKKLVLRVALRVCQCNLVNHYIK